MGWVYYYNVISISTKDDYWETTTIIQYNMYNTIQYVQYNTICTIQYITIPLSGSHYNVI